MILSCYILDDEFHAIGILENFIRQVPGLALLGSAEDPLAALAELPRLRPDVLFLDVDMPGISGLDFAPLVGHGTLIVLTTGYAEFAVEAFNLQIFDFLLKPLEPARFLVCVNRARQLLSNGGRPRLFYVKTGIQGQFSSIDPSALIYIEAAGNYVQLYLPGEKHLAYLSISEVADFLPAAEFSRIHKSFIVCHSAIRSLEPGQLKLRTGEVLPIGRTYKAAFLVKLEPQLFRSRRED